MEYLSMVTHKNVSYYSATHIKAPAKEHLGKRGAGRCGQFGSSAQNSLVTDVENKCVLTWRPSVAALVCSVAALA